MDRSDRSARHYSSTPLATLREGCSVQENRDLLLAIYDQSCSAWKLLVDVRFKLLGLVPAVSIAILTAILTTKPSGTFTTASRVVISLLGLASVFGLFIYDRRNSALHDDLISRARKVEDELGIDTGIFRGRLKASGIFKHDVAINVIYGASMFAWAITIVLLAFRC